MFITYVQEVNYIPTRKSFKNKSEFANDDDDVEIIIDILRRF